MDCNLWKTVRDAIRSADASLPRTGRRPTFSDRLVVKMFFWSVAHDRPRSWATRRDSYPGRLFRPRRLPSTSQFCKRLHAPRVVAMITHTQQRLADLNPTAGHCFLDGKALPVAESSRDPDARTGHGNGRFSRGYKLHALTEHTGKIRAFHLTAMNGGEPTTARAHLVQHVPAGSQVVADGNYDGAPLYTAIDEQGATLLTPQKKNKRTQRAWDMTCPPRRRAMEDWRDRPAQTRKRYARRTAIERTFSALTTFAGGLAPLPAWVRRLPRVRLWVTAKIALYHARLKLRTAAQ